MTPGALMPAPPGACCDRARADMSTDYREKEREFLDSLKDDTGRDVREWMAAISAQNLPHRNDIIDWLRQQGFMFSKASWLERVHHNGGKAIYSDAVVARRAMPKRAAPAVDLPSPPLDQQQVLAAPSPPRVAAQPPAAPTDALEALLATAKAYRPLAQHILREIAKAVPDSTPVASSGHVSLVLAGREFAVLVISARELRLGLTLNGQPVEPPLQTAKFPNPAVRIAPAITHMAVVNDVRQIDAALIAWIVKGAQ